ncbi:endonuclease Q family protein [Pseudogracilibacillus sp. SO30301A]|uniref:endonuclease Q family protein n=1 Tax=Pseudogracilibacillus sp. SO30301A TaxID=3098291 RepID=UPI00300DD4F8
MLNKFFADMHIHIGRNMNNHPVKITASKQLTLKNILIEASRRKGIDMVGVIDCQSPLVQQEIAQLIRSQQAEELQEGGIRFENVTLLMGAEIEVYDEHCKGPIHVLCYFPTLATINSFTEWLSGRMKNVHLSSQRYYGTATDLQLKVKELSGLFIPAHVFTPFKSLYGKGVRNSLTEVLNPNLIDGIELGLSSDTEMADQIVELHKYTFLSNSDSHSLQKLAREYQQIMMKEPTFQEFSKALKRVNGRQIVANYGMNPKLGKYYTTVCQVCMKQAPYKSKQCSHCQSKKIINGVFDRITELKDTDESNQRPPYYYQVPLDYLPGLGKKTFEKLLDHFATEMTVIHHIPYQQLATVIPEKLAKMIVDMRKGELDIEAGGGGKYGRVSMKKLTTVND